MRDETLALALEKSVWASWARAPIAGDASSRRYFRLSQNGQPTAILMDDPTRDTQRFADIAQFLTASRLSAPEILYHNPNDGVMIITDLGQTDFATHIISTPQDEVSLYTAATDILSVIHTLRPALSLGKIDKTTAPEMINVAAMHYAPTPIHLDTLHRAMQNAFVNHVDPTLHLALRDFHAENLIWRTNLHGPSRVGLLDFQDACFAPAGYDLMSLLRDARRDVDPDIATHCIAQFCQSINIASAQLACISAQRNLRILGIFARLAKQHGKTKYLSLLPRVWAHLMTDLAHPALTDLRNTVLFALPPPDATTLQRLQP
ncbi:aminoglycoside phosphotransferase family protein [Yoonia sp. MH D7]